MTRIDDTKVPGTAEIYRKYQELLRKAAQNEEGRLATAQRTAESSAQNSASGKSTAGLNSPEMQMAEACRDFEALFIQQMFSEMRKGLREDSVFGDDGASLAADRNRNSFFRDQMYQGLSTDMANQGGFGIGSVLFEQLYRQEHPELFPAATENLENLENLPQNAAAGPQGNSDNVDAVHRLLRQQKQALQQTQTFSQSQLENRFFK